MSRHPQVLTAQDSVLLVIDVQERINTVMAGQGHVPRLRTLMEASRRLGVPLLVSEQYPKGLGPTIADLAALQAESPVVKDTFSCCGEPRLVDDLVSTGRRQVVVTGIEAHVCVLQTVLDLIDAGFQVHVPHDAVQSRRAEDKQWALHRMAAAGATVTSTESALFEMLERCGTEDFRAVAKIIKGIPVEGD